MRLPLTPAQLVVGQRLGAYLRHARGDRTLVEVAQAAAISPETLRKIETGRLPTPAFTTIAALARVLAVPLDDLAHILPHSRRLSGDRLTDATVLSVDRRYTKVARAMPPGAGPT